MATPTADPTPYRTPTTTPNSSIKLGRGGAGNHHTLSEIASLSAPRPSDLESQRGPSSSLAPSSSSSKSPMLPSKPPQFQRGGRGGAGNYINTADAARAATQERMQLPKPVATETVETITADGKKVLTTRVKYRVAVGSRTSSGRGGVGNINEARMLQQKRREEQGRMREERERESREEAHRETERLVGAPPKAFLGGRLAGGKKLFG